MKTFRYVVQDPVGLHARPAGMLVKEAGKGACSVTIESKGKSADAKRLLAVMGLGVTKGDEISITVEGKDEEAVAAALEAFCKENL